MKKYKSDIFREVARSAKWQNIYNLAKDISSIKIFKNNSDFTDLQLSFLRWLEIYNSLETDLALNKPYISREIIDDDIRTEAYLLMKSKEKNIKKDIDKPRKSKKRKQSIPHQTTPGIIFVDKKRS